MPDSPHPSRAGSWVDGDGDVECWFVGRRPLSSSSLADVLRVTDPTRHGASASHAAWLEQVHGSEVRRARPGWSGRGDALVTLDAGLVPVIVTADCVPVLVATPTRLAAIHAGWRGIAAGVVAAALERLTNPCRSRDAGPTEDTGMLDRGIIAWVGPAASDCCYEVGDDVAYAIVEASAPSVVRATAGRPRVNLAAAVRHQLMRAGVSEVRVSGICTCCHDAWWSYRREGAAAGRNLAWIARRSYCDESRAVSDPPHAAGRTRR